MYWLVSTSSHHQVLFLSMVDLCQDPKLLIISGCRWGKMNLKPHILLKNRPSHCGREGYGIVVIWLENTKRNIKAREYFRVEDEQIPDYLFIVSKVIHILLDHMGEVACFSQLRLSWSSWRWGETTSQTRWWYSLMNFRSFTVNNELSNKFLSYGHRVKFSKPLTPSLFTTTNIFYTLIPYLPAS